jgi:hypothetical protein
LITQTTNATTQSATGSLSSRTLSGLALVIEPPPVLSVATSITETGTQTSLGTTTAGFEVQLEDIDGAGGSPPSGQGSPGEPSGVPGPLAAAGPQGDSQPPAQAQPKPISPVTAVLPGLVGQVRPTVLRAPPGVPGIAQPYSSDGNIGRW